MNLEGDLKKINISHLINSNSLIPQFLKTEIFNNKNLNVNLRLLGDTLKNFNDFTEINLSSKIQEGLIDIDNSKFTWRNNVNFSLVDSLIYSKEGELILPTQIDRADKLVAERRVSLAVAERDSAVFASETDSSVSAALAQLKQGDR